MRYRVSATITFLTCPCHIPILLFLLSGTAAGALLYDNVWLVVAVIVPIFLYAAITAMRSFEHAGSDAEGIGETTARAEAPEQPD